MSADFPESAAATAGVWDALADWWDAAIGSGNATQDLLVEPTQERLLDLRSGQIVLDIACGAGRFTRRMAAPGGRGRRLRPLRAIHCPGARQNTPPDLR